MASDFKTGLAPTDHGSHGDGFDASENNQGFSFGVEVPSREDIATYPKAWYLFGTTRELARGPVTREIIGQPLVGFMTESGKAGVLHSRCSHFGSDLGNGCVSGESIQCPFHGWEYGTDGQCTRIPAAQEIPGFARQQAFPTHVMYGNMYFFNADTPLFPFPFFEGIDPGELVAAPPFEFVVDAPWYMIGSNGVDRQHFQCGHDRKILSGPEVEHPNRFVHRMTASFEVIGSSLTDRLMRRFAGDRVTLHVDDWCSTFILTRSTLSKTESFGVLSTVPIGPRQTLVHVTCCGWKSKTGIARVLWDPLSARLRRLFIREFLRPDVKLLAQTDYSPHSLLEIDQQYVEYMQWLAALPR